jgi:2'-5' RNA ligase
MRPYTPHITLGRPQNTFSINMIDADPTQWAFTLNAFGLYESRQEAHNIGEYILLKEFLHQK